MTVLASSVETYVKSQEQSREQDTARHMATYSNQLEELRAEVSLTVRLLFGFASVFVKLNKNINK